MPKWPTHDSQPTTTTSQEEDELSTAPPSVVPNDVEKHEIEKNIVPDKVSAFKGLGWLDRFLAVWILLAMAIGKAEQRKSLKNNKTDFVLGILLGNFVPSTGPALEKGQFVGVSAPIGMSLYHLINITYTDLPYSHWLVGNDVSDLMQGPVRNTASRIQDQRALDSSRFQHSGKLAHCSILDAGIIMGFPSG
jgi:hypothetical protein